MKPAFLLHTVHTQYNSHTVSVTKPAFLLHAAVGKGGKETLQAYGSDREGPAKERAEPGVFLAEASGYYGLDKTKW
jgi:hypothetical protein